MLDFKMEKVDLKKKKKLKGTSIIFIFIIRRINPLHISII